MSYSYSVDGTSVQDALEKSAQKFAEVIQNQPEHERERQVVQDYEKALVTLIGEPEAGKVVRLGRWGSVSWDPASGKTLGASGNVDVYHASLPPTP